MYNRGRKRIYSSVTPNSLDNVVGILNDSILTHNENAVDISYLIEYFKGKQPILQRVKEVRPEINNKIVINNAQMIVRVINGYFLGQPIQNISRTGEYNAELDRLNSVFAYENKASVDKEVGDYQSICGVGYKFIYTDTEDIIPFEIRSLNPLNTFVVYSRDTREKPLMGVVRTDDVYEVYTDNKYYKFIMRNGITVETTDLVESNPYMIGGIPIVEYPNNVWRIGDFEVALELLDAINNVESDRANDVEQFVQSFFKFINCEIDEKTFQELRNEGVIQVSSKGNANVEVDILSNTLDNASTQVYSDNLKDYLYAIIGIPNRDKRGGGGGDTGQAVELREGWADLEVVARNKELVYRKSEMKFLGIAGYIASVTMGLDIPIEDIDIKFSRNKSNNLLVKAQAYMNLIGTKTLDPADCLNIVDLVTDVNEYINRGKAFWGESYANNEPVEEITPEEKEDVDNE